MGCCIEETTVKLDFLTDPSMLLMVEKGIRGWGGGGGVGVGWGVGVGVGVGWGWGWGGGWGVGGGGGGISMTSSRYGKANNKYMGNKYYKNETAKYITYLDANNLYGWAMSKPLPTHEFKRMDDNEFASWRNIPCILEVDLEYPKDLHDLLNDHPFTPKIIVISKVDKLIPNLNNTRKHKSILCGFKTVWKVMIKNYKCS